MTKIDFNSIQCCCFHLKCLLHRNKKVREGAFRNSMARLVTETFNWIKISTKDVDIDHDCDLLVLNLPIELYSKLLSNKMVSFRYIYVFLMHNHIIIFLERLRFA